MLYVWAIYKILIICIQSTANGGAWDLLEQYCNTGARKGLSGWVGTLLHLEEQEGSRERTVKSLNMALGNIITHLMSLP